MWGEIDSQHAMTFGTLELPVPSRAFVVGPLSGSIEGGALRALCWRGVEVLRGLDFLARDEYWGTFAPENPREDLTSNDTSFHYARSFMLAEGGLDCRLEIVGSSDGRVVATARVMVKRAFETRRIGFVLLHPIKDAFRDVLTVTHADGSQEKTAFPDQISPSQPVFDIAGLAYCHANVGVDIAFEGDVFEMEDQRNWTDASYKTYSRPIGWPAPYIIDAGDEVAQTITVALADQGQASATTDTRAKRQTVQLGAKDGTLLPSLALAVESGWLPDTDAIASFDGLGVKRLLVRTSSDEEDAFLGALEPLRDALDPEIDLEIVIPDEGDAERELRRVAAACDREGLTPETVFALPRGYLANYQPDGDWPTGVDVDEACRAARKVFPRARIGGGVLTNFVEFNRKRPPLDDCDYISHATSAIIHAADDRSVMETLEALPAVYRSAGFIAPRKAYRLGLQTIGMRSNPHGPFVENNREFRRPMVLYDPRHRALFGAAFAVAVYSTTADFNIESLALAGPCGPFGLVHQRAALPLPIYDDGQDAHLYPIYHVIKSLARFGAASRLAVGGLPDGVYGTAAAMGGRRALWIANTAKEARPVMFDQDVAVRVLNTDTFMAAASKAEWVQTAPAEIRREVHLEPYAVLFGEISETSP